VLVVGALGGGAWWWMARAPVAPVARFAEPVPIPIAAELAPPAAAAPVDEIRPIARDTVYFVVASRQLELFEKDTAVLLAEYRANRQLLETGAISWETFVDHLGMLEAHWWSVSYRILDDEELSALPLSEFRGTLLASARQWRAFLRMYAQGLQQWSPPLVYQSMGELDRADRLLVRASRYLQ
jgi:hypothetical protein